MAHLSDTQVLENRSDPRAFLARAGGGKTIERFAKNQKIFSQGEVADTVFFIQEGKVKLTVLSELGKEAVVGIFSEGQFFGEGCLRGAKLRAATSHAMEECLITSITKRAMLAALESEPEFSAFFIAYLLSRLLLLLADFGKEGGGAPVAITLSQETLAEMIGTTRSRVSFFMNKFRKKGFISYNGKIEVHPSLLDSVLREKPQITDDE